MSARTGGQASIQPTFTMVEGSMNSAEGESFLQKFLQIDVA